MCPPITVSDSCKGRVHLRSPRLCTVEFTLYDRMDSSARLSLHHHLLLPCLNTQTMGSSDERTAPSTTVPTPAEETRSAKIADLIKASKLYHQVEQVKEAVYENEGSFPGKEASLVCPACRSDDSVGPKEKVRPHALLDLPLIPSPPPNSLLDPASPSLL